MKKRDHKNEIRKNNTIEVIGWIRLDNDIFYLSQGIMGRVTKVQAPNEVYFDLLQDLGEDCEGATKGCAHKAQCIVIKKGK